MQANLSKLKSPPLTAAGIRPMTIWDGLQIQIHDSLELLMLIRHFVSWTLLLSFASPTPFLLSPSLNPMPSGRLKCTFSGAHECAV